MRILKKHQMVTVIHPCAWCGVGDLARPNQMHDDCKIQMNQRLETMEHSS
jgi:hypothetical protein